MLFSQNDRIVFAGDSVTDMGSNNNVGGVADPCRGYVRIVENLLAAAYPDMPVHVINAGISGDTSSVLLGRFDRDVVAHNPEWVSILIGINDVWRQFDRPHIPEQQVPPEQYESNLNAMLDKLEGKVRGVFLMTPFYIEPDRTEPLRARTDEYCAICRRVAEQRGGIFVDIQGMFERYCGIRHSSYIAWDRVHPNAVGGTLIAREFLKHCGFDFNRGCGE